MKRPVILIDFDGVFNILEEYESAVKDWDDIVLVTIPYDDHPTEKEFTVAVRQANIDFFVKLSKLDVVDIRWLTTWVDNTEKFPYYLGLPILPWVKREEVETEWDWWKLNAAKKVIGDLVPETPVLWIDDDHGFDASAARWLKTQPQVFALATNSKDALHPKDIEKISIFVKKYTGTDVSLEVQ